MPEPIRVALADDHPVIRLSVEAALDSLVAVQHVGSAADSTQLMALLDTQPCDVLLTDYAMPGGTHGDGMALMAVLRERHPDVRVVLLTSMEDAAAIRSVLMQGVLGILSKADMAHVDEAIQAAYRRRRYLSPRIARLFAL